ncbi:SEC-C metal-binding domain-containing protein [Candidatus Nitrotoga sp. 1052]
MRRNELCSCDSGKRYKHCCGSIKMLVLRRAPKRIYREDEWRAVPLRE